jgi:hypothetical protein
MGNKKVILFYVLMLTILTPPKVRPEYLFKEPRAEYCKDEKQSAMAQDYVKWQALVPAVLKLSGIL